MLQPPGSMIELCHVVADMDAAIEQFISLAGAGPFFVADLHYAEGHRYRGKPAPLAIRVAFGFTGGLLIELVQPLAGDESIFTEALAARGPGHHHFILREDFEIGYERLKALGYEIVLENKTAYGERAVLFDTTAINGGYIEVTDLNITFKPLLEALSAAQEDWDGSNPQRPLASVFDYGAAK